MFTKISIIFVLASLTCGEYVKNYNYPGYTGVNQRTNSNFLPYGAHRYGQYSNGVSPYGNQNLYTYGSRHYGRYNEVNPYGNSNLYRHGSHQYGRYNGVNPYGNSNLYPYGSQQYGRYDGGATSYANSNLQSYRNDGYGKYDGYNSINYDKGQYPYPRYNFNYEVNDPTTGDKKSQKEFRDGDTVKGSYTVSDPDGTTRNVEYEANDRDGFNAVVSKQGVAHHPATYGHGKY